MPRLAPDETRLTPPELLALQRRKLARVLECARAASTFYQARLPALPADAGLESLPFTTRADLEADQRAHPPFGTNLTEPPERYTRYHQTSASGGGAPLRWLDTAESWQWWVRCWTIILRAAGVAADDRVLFPFSFGPFIGFWSAFEAAEALGCLCLPAGGMSTAARLEYLIDTRATVVCCTPTYALRMADAAAERGVDLAASAVRTLIVAGEPGGNIPATRARLERAWGARVWDHAGMTEVGAWGVELSDSPGGLHVIETEFIAEVIDPRTLRPCADGTAGELVLTNLGRLGSPLIRYRTGDQVCLRRGATTSGCHWARLDGGVLGRLDDMLLIRGNNVFPATIEGILRDLVDVAEYRIEVNRRGPLNELELHIEPRIGAVAADVADRVAAAVRDRLHFRPIVRLAAPGSLPRPELKSQRLVRRSEH